MSARCFECGAPADHHHHVVPRSLGGRRTVPLCGACHARAHGLDDRTWAGHAGLTRAALQAKKARGELTGTAPYGYRVASDGLTLEEDPVEAQAVAMLWGLRATGASIRKIADELNARGVPARGGRWHRTTVARVLQAGEAR